MLTRKALVYAKIESTYGTDPTPDSANDAMVVFDLEVSPEVDALERIDKGISVSRLKELSGKQRVNVSFTCEFIGSGTAGNTVKGLAACLKACGMSETLSGGVSSTFAFISASWPSVTLYIYLDGIQFQVQGAVGTWELNLVAGETPKIKFDMKGLWELPTDVTFPTSYTPNATQPQVLKNGTVTIESYAAVFRSIVLRSNNVITERADLRAATGIAGFQITDRNPEAEVTIEAVLLATNNFWNNFAADTVAALSIAWGTGTAGSIWTISAPYFRIREIPIADEDGILVHPLVGQLGRSAVGAGNDELTMVNT